MNLKTKKINSLSKLPEQAHKGDMFDLFANEDIVLNSFESKIVKLGLAFDIPKGYRIKIFSRSSLPIKKQVIVSNGTGIIDTCLDKDTKITLVNGEEDTIENITKRVNNGEKLYAISINEKDGSYAAGLIEKGINNGLKDVYRYYFDKGGYIDCTENHKVRLNRKREYKEIGKIKNTNSLTPLNLKNDKDGYLIATSWKNGKKYFSVRLHRDIYVNYYNTDYPQVVHHKDENVKNNNPENLQGCSYKEHSMKIHNNAKQFDEYRNSEEGKKHQKSFGVRMAHNINRLKSMFGRYSGLKGYKHTEQAKINIRNGILKSWKEKKEERVKKIGNSIKALQSKETREKVKNSFILKTLNLVKEMLENDIPINEKSFNDYKYKKITELGYNNHNGNSYFCSFKMLKEKYGDIDNIKRNAVNHKIIKSEYLGKKEVYDLCIKDYHNFFANGICVHNCCKNEVGLICHTLPKNFFGFLINKRFT